MFIKIKVDTNDADYLELTSEIDSDNFIIIRPLIKEIKHFKSESLEIWQHNFPYGEYFPRKDMGEKDIYEIYPSINKEVIEVFMKLCPYGEHGFHTILEIEIFDKINIIKFL